MDKKNIYISAGLIYGPKYSALDHLACLCSILQIPIIVTEKSIYDFIIEFYPKMNVVLSDHKDVAMFITENFDVIFSSQSRIVFDEIFFYAQKTKNKKVHTIWCPQFVPTENQFVQLSEELKNTLYALTYGQMMIDVFDKINILSTLNYLTQIGNFRLEYFKENKFFYDELIKKKISRFLRVKKKKIFYESKWNDNHKTCSFFDIGYTLIDHLPEKYDLIIKLDPKLRIKYRQEIEQFKKCCENKSEIYILEDFPPIYPLLEFADIYIVDDPSLCFDFIYFNKPMIILNQNNINFSESITECALQLKSTQYSDIFKIVEAYLPFDSSYFQEARKNLYSYTFGDTITYPEIIQKINELYSHLPEKELNFF